MPARDKIAILSWEQGRNVGGLGEVAVHWRQYAIILIQTHSMLTVVKRRI